MKGKLLSSIQWLMLLGFGTALFVLLLIGMMTLHFLRQAAADDGWVEHTHLVIENLQSSLLAEREIGTYMRSYILTGAKENLEAYRTSAEKLSESLLMVQQLTTDNPPQQQRLVLLQPLVHQRLSTTVEVIKTKERAGQQAAIAILFQRKALLLVNEIHLIIDDMMTDERNLLRVRMAEQERSAARLQSVILIGSSCAIVFLTIAAVLIHKDLRVRQKAEQDLRDNQARLQNETRQLQIANKELEAFSYSVSHDLRAPLRGIEGFSRVIEENYKDRLDAEGQAYFDRIGAAAKRMGILIDQILDLSRISRNPLQIQEVDLAVQARAIADELKKADPTRQVTWTVPDTLLVRGDPVLLNAVMTNLIQNAWKFTSGKPQGSIEIAKMTEKDKTVYYVRDNGAGFDMAYKNKLFQAFQRLHNHQEFPGTGIGLATVQRIIARHGGTVWAEGEVGQGAVFYFTLN